MPPLRKAGFRALAFLALAFFVGAATAHADPITITTGNPGNAGTDNVLFNDGSLPHSGTLVQGNFSGAGAGFIVNFTSSSGTGNLVGSGGQATVLGGTGNTPFTQLTFGLDNNATFTKAIFNLDVDNGAGDGNATIKVNYFDTMTNTFFSQTFAVSANGQNFFAVEASMGALITSIEISTNDTSFINAAQFRLGGFQAGPVPEPTTMLLLGTGLVGIAAKARRRRKAAK